MVQWVRKTHGEQQRSTWRPSCQPTQSEENRLNREAAERLATSVWKHMADTVAGRCKEWNEVAGEQVLTCRETMLRDLRILRAGRPHQLIVHFDSRKLLIILKNSARLSHETDMILLIEGYATGRGARHGPIITASVTLRC